MPAPKDPVKYEEYEQRIKHKIAVMNEAQIKHILEHPEKDYCIGENPNMFVLLCTTCHSKTNGNFERRARCADHFRDMINNEYGGICWTEEPDFAPAQAGEGVTS